VTAKKKGRRKAAQKKAKPAKPATRRVFSWRELEWGHPAILVMVPLILLCSFLASHAIAEILFA